MPLYTRPLPATHTHTKDKTGIRGMQNIAISDTKTGTVKAFWAELPLKSTKCLCRFFNCRKCHTHSYFRRQPSEVLPPKSASLQSCVHPNSFSEMALYLEFFTDFSIQNSSFKALILKICFIHMAQNIQGFYE